VGVASLLASDKIVPISKTVTTPNCNGVSSVGCGSESMSNDSIPGCSFTVAALLSGVEVKGKPELANPSLHCGSHDTPPGVISEHVSAAVCGKLSASAVNSDSREHANRIAVIDINTGAPPSLNKPALPTASSSSMLQQSAANSPTHSSNSCALSSSTHPPVTSQLTQAHTHTPLMSMSSNQSGSRLVLPSNTTHGILEYLRAVQQASPSLLPTAVSLPSLTSVVQKDSASSWLAKLSAADLKVLVTHLSQFPQLWTNQITPATVLKHLNTALGASQAPPSPSTVASSSHPVSPNPVVITTAPITTPVIPVATVTSFSDVVAPAAAVAGESLSFDSTPVKITTVPNTVSTSRNSSLVHKDSTNKPLTLGKRKKRSDSITEEEEEEEEEIQPALKKFKNQDLKGKTSEQDSKCATQQDVAVNGSLETVESVSGAAQEENLKLAKPNSANTCMVTASGTGEVFENNQGGEKVSLTRVGPVAVAATGSEGKEKLVLPERVDEGTPELLVAITPEEVYDEANASEAVKGSNGESSRDTGSREYCWGSGAAGLDQPTRNSVDSDDNCKRKGSSNVEEAVSDPEDPLCDYPMDSQESLNSSPVSTRLEKVEEDLMSSPAQQGTIMLAGGDHTPQSCDADGKHQKGVLKRVSQFDTPTSARQSSARKRVQFASETDVREVDCDNKGHKVTPIRSKGKVSKAPYFIYFLS